MSESKMLKYRIEHRTTYSYSGRNDLCHSFAHLRPIEGDELNIVSQDLVITPNPKYHSNRLDYFGNRVDYFSVETSHESLSVLSDLIVEKPFLPNAQDPRPSNFSWNGKAPPFPTTDEDGHRLSDYVIPSRGCPFIQPANEFVQSHATEGKNLFDLAKGVMSSIFTEFTYTPGATDIMTPLTEVAASKKGVCQDFAHFMIAGLRSIGIPARYVSGYLETLPPPGGKKLRGADASHAWVEAWIPGEGWVGFDPTNDKMPGNRHVKLAHGRDYFDVQPLRGIFIGSGTQALSVEVDVTQMEEALDAK